MTVAESLNRAVTHIRQRSRQLLPGPDINPNTSSELVDKHEKHIAVNPSSNAEHQYEPPDHPPPQRAERLPLKPVDLPLIEPLHRYNLSAQGWTTVTLSSQEQTARDVRNAIQALFAAGKTFLDRDDSYKEQFRTNRDSEEGWLSIPGEKQFITIRTSDNVPEEIREPVIAAWSIIGSYLNDLLSHVAKSLDLKPEALTKFSEPCTRLTKARTATMLRIFRYEGWEDKVVAEPHNDLGLLSLVAGNSPGLEVWNGMNRSFYPIERSYKDLSSSATVLVGRQLQRLSSGRYLPGGHQVRSYPKSKRFSVSNNVGKRFRYSIVFVLRCHGDATIDVKSLSSPITGTPSMVTDCMSTRDFFMSIKGSHYNINTNIETRHKQREKVEEMKRKRIERDIS